MVHYRIWTTSHHMLIHRDIDLWIIPSYYQHLTDMAILIGFCNVLNQSPNTVDGRRKNFYSVRDRNGYPGTRFNTRTRLPVSIPAGTRFQASARIFLFETVSFLFPSCIICDLRMCFVQINLTGLTIGLCWHNNPYRWLIPTGWLTVTASCVATPAPPPNQESHVSKRSVVTSSFVLDDTQLQQLFQNPAACMFTSSFTIK
jgi:hypothetical protein